MYNSGNFQKFCLSLVDDEVILNPVKKNIFIGYVQPSMPDPWSFTNARNARSYVIEHGIGDVNGGIFRPIIPNLTQIEPGIRCQIKFAHSFKPNQFTAARSAHFPDLVEYRLAIVQIISINLPAAVFDQTSDALDLSIAHFQQSQSFIDNLAG